MSSYMCIDGASCSPLFLKALEQLVQAHAADLRQRALNSPSLQIQPISWPRTPRTPLGPKNNGVQWDLPDVMTPCFNTEEPDVHDPWEQKIPRQPSTQEMMTFPLSNDNSPTGMCAEGEVEAQSKDIHVDAQLQRKRSKESSAKQSSCPTESGTQSQRSSVSSVFSQMREATTDAVLGRTSLLLKIEPAEEGSCTDRMRKIVNHKFFEAFFSTIIVLNCFTMGLEAEQAVRGPASDFSEIVLVVSEHLFTALFTVELMFKFCGYGFLAFSPSFPDGKWNILDILLVLVTGVFFSWILPILSAIFGFDSEGGIFRTLTIFRSVRLLRLVRVFHRVPMFREAWLLLRGLMDSARILVFTVMVIFFVTYLFAILGMMTISTELVERRDEAILAANTKRYDYLSELLEYVGGLDLMMYTLVQTLTQDSWNGIVRSILKELNWVWIYFYAYISVAVFVLMNLVTAIIVDNALSSSRLDEDEALKKKQKQQDQELKQLEHLFTLMDSDGSGTLSWDEFKAAFEDPEMKKKWKLLDFEPEECRELWGLLDDGDGEIETHEFFEGLSKMKGVAQSKDIFRVQKDLEAVKIAIRTGEPPPSPKRQVSS